MTVPRKVAIMGQTFSVSVHAKDEALPGSEGHDGVVGLNSLNTQRIHIRTVGIEEHNVSIGTQRDTLLHEVLHGVFYLGDLEHYGGKRAGRHSENLINSLSTVLLATLRANPALVAYLMEKD